MTSGSLTETVFFTRYVRPRLNLWGTYDRVENAVGTGMPDISYAIGGTQGWLETKVPKEGKLYFQLFQLPWLQRRVKHTGGLGVFVLASDGATVWLYRPAELLAAPRVTYKRWVVLQQSELEPIEQVGLLEDWSVIRAWLSLR